MKKAKLQSVTGTTGVSSEQIATQANVLNNISQNKQTAKAWVQFDGQNAETIRGQHNVSSITDLGVGAYKVNFAIPVDVNYAVLLSSLFVNSFINSGNSYYNKTINNFSIQHAENNVNVDTSSMSAVVFGL